MRKTYEKNIITNQNLEKWIINIVMYVNIIFGETPIYLKLFIYLATKFWALWINKYENLHYWKKQKNNNEKTVSQFSIKL